MKWIKSLTTQFIKRMVASKVFKRKAIVVGLLILAVFFIVAIFAYQIVPFNPQELDVFNRLAPPSSTHLFGTDKVGRDVFSRVLVGTRFTVMCGVSVVLITMLGGFLFGVLAGFFPFLDNLIMRIMDGMMAFPPILLAILITAVLGQSLPNIILALSIVYIPRIARIVRSSVLVVGQLSYVEAARALGLSSFRIILRHILPNVLSPVIVQGTFVFAYAVLTESALSFLGIGLPPTIPTWGNIMNEGRDVYQSAYWCMLAPGACIVLMVFAINMVGDGLRDACDPLTLIRR